jgi:hypothetical protein
MLYQFNFADKRAMSRPFFPSGDLTAPDRFSWAPRFRFCADRGALGAALRAGRNLFKLPNVIFRVA